MNIEIRQLRAADAVVYREIRLEGLRLAPEAFGSSFEEEVDLPIERWRDGLDGSSPCFAVFANGALAAVATLAPAGNAKAAHKAFIYAVFTRPGFRGRGLSTQLMERLLAEGRKLGRTSFRLSVSESNDQARRIYERLGFVTYGREPRATVLAGQPIALDLMALDDPAG